MSETTPTTITSILQENARLNKVVSQLESRLKNHEESIDAISPAIFELKHRTDILLGAINHCLTEFPDSDAAEYLRGIVASFFRK